MRKKNSEDPTSVIVRKISDAEWVVMQVVWDQEAVTANEVVDVLDGKQDWKPKTVHTLLRRLVDKEALNYEKSGREFVFRPSISRETAEKAQSRSFISRIFAGQATPFLARFLESESFAPEEIEELKRILERKQP